ncbi:hypothetical protein [uncultured Thermanaerothrix sp.]|uniref:hypothetical protein n=1 Tax=uncultured Thermanaerothrix sp. TaxID=1195149 RepID=UPI00260AC6C7|nr:hypothetical protein [uncultured Thermanaerothrix sp.]
MINALFLKVNPKWEEARELQRRVAWRKLRALLGAIGLTAFLGLFLWVINIELQWKIVGGVLIFSPYLLFFGLEDLIGEENSNAQLLSALVFLIAMLLTVAAGFSFPRWDSPISPDWRFLGIGLMPIILVVLLIRAGWGAPLNLRALGFQRRLWLVYVVEGGLMGLALGAHLIYVLGFLPVGGFLEPDRLSLWRLVWWSSVAGTLLAPIEELALRGRGIILLKNGLSLSERNSLVFSVGLSLFVWLPLALVLWSGPVAAVFLGYRMVLAFLNAYVRLRDQSLIFGMASNLGFSLLAGWVLLA